jgi:hypothetical protein
MLGLLRVDPERRFLSHPLKSGLAAAEWVKLNKGEIVSNWLRIFIKGEIAFLL